MSVAKVTEIISSSSRSFDDALKTGLQRADATINGIASAWVKDQSVTVKNGKIDEYRVHLKITFVLSGEGASKKKAKKKAKKKSKKKK